MKPKKQAAKQTTTNEPAATTPATPKAAKAEQTPEQAARSKRAEAKALRLAAEHTTPNGAKPLIERATALEAEADAIAPRKAATKAAKEPRPTCTATKADGTPCTAKCMAERDVCVDHRPAVEHLTDAELATVQMWLVGLDSAQFVALVGWGKVRAAIKAGTIS